MHLPLRRLATLCIAALALACGPRAEAPGDRPRPTRRADLITADEIAQRSWQDVYELVLTLRANWLNDRGPDTITGPRGEVQVHLDGVRVGGGAVALQGVSAMYVTSIRYHSPNAAAARWGLGYGHGAIEISTRRRAPGN